MAKPTWYVLVRDEKMEVGGPYVKNRPRLVYEKETQADSVVNSDIGERNKYRKVAVQPLEDIE